MKKYQFFFLTFFLAIRISYSQVTINNIQIASTIVSVDASTPNNPNSYTWSEISNTKQGVNISVIPPEKGEIYLQQNNAWINYNTWNWGYMARLEVSYDGGNYHTIFSNQIKDATGWIKSPFSSLGYHTIAINWISYGSISYHRDYDVYVVPQSQKFYKDNYGNTLTTWEGGNPNKVILISEGFDPYNTTYSEYLRYKGKDLFEPLIQAGYKIYFLNYAYNSQDMRNSAAIFNSAARYISSINSNTQMIAAGISMGGVVVRYALAKAENDGNPLPFNKFVSIDAPQKGALFARDLQDYMKDHGLSNFQKHGLDNNAAKELLIYNTYGNLHVSFYNELNNLNGGTGYPSLTENIGVSFSNNSINPGNGRWIVISYESIYVPGTFIVKTSWLNSELKVPGSYLPKTSGVADPSPYNVYWIFAGMLQIERDPNNNPTFISYNSSLDIVNGNSKFSETIQANANYFHDQFPPEVVTALLNNFLPPSPLAVNITGPSYLNSRQSGTWTANASGGTPSYHYQWWYEYPSSGLYATKTGIQPLKPVHGYWFKLGFDSPTLTRSDDEDFELKCDVTDAANNTVTSSVFYVTVGGSVVSPLKSSLAKNTTQDYLLPTETKLFSNYPNPFNPSTTIKYQIKEPGFVSLKVYDILGKEVANLVQGNKSAGFYSVSFDASKLSSGLYIYRLRVNNYVESKKMLLTK